MSQDITAFDGFCGAGGSTEGLEVAGVRVTHAVNHNRLAIETHQTNHPNTEHDWMDFRFIHPKYYPRTTMLWMSPECTNHSISKGRKRKNIEQLDLWGESQVNAEEERSRATMREVVEFATYHRNEIVIVENVVDIRHWQHYDAWLTEMLNLGYDYKALYLNSQFFGVPQSRDRIYIVFWRKGNKAPDLEFRPRANCPVHGEVDSVQSWKREDKQWGKYSSKKGQYVYRCPHCAVEVVPYYVPAASVIDWSLPSEKVGDRKKPLKPKTIQRILAGLKKFSKQAVLIDLGYEGGDRAYSPALPLPTQTSRQTLALLQPCITELRDGNVAHGIDDPLSTIVGSARHHGLVIPPFMVVLKNSYSKDGNYTLPPRSLDEALTTIVAAGSQHALIIPPYITSQHENADGTATRTSGIDAPLPCITSFNNEHQLVTPPMVVAYNRSNWTYATADEPMPTVTAIQHHALIYAGDELPAPEEMLPECGFRMLEPEELKLGMSFDETYIILGNKRQQVKQIGNAVCPYVATALAQRCVESLS